MTSVFESFPMSNTNVAQASISQPISSTPVTVKDAMPAAAVNAEQKEDTVEISAKKEEKKGPIRKIKDFISSIKKSFATIGEYTKGIIKGIIRGFLAGGAVYTAGNIVNAIKEKAAKNTEAIVKKFPSKTAGAVAAGITFIASIWAASLNATEARSNIEHRWEGHNNK